jgi:hypothetical protein
MSFDLIVEAREWPEDIAVAWEQAMRDSGCPARMQIHPGRRVEECGGFLPWNLADGSLAGCEVIFSSFPVSDGTDVVARVLFTTPVGRSEEDQCLQWFAAATLARVTMGTLCDPQEGVTYKGDVAITEAQKRCSSPQS